MGGAHVAAVDDASAVYWNPGGLAAGSFFSLVLDRGASEAGDDSDPQIGSQSGTLLALAFPALGATYYRLRVTAVEPAVFPADQLDAPRSLDGTPAARVTSLITHHTGVTLVQSLFAGVSVGTTLKLVRGVAASGLIAANRPRDEMLDEAEDLVGSGSNEFDADIGVMAAFGTLRAGLALRNVREPEFDVPGGVESLTLYRQVRAGVAFAVATGLLVSADLDLQSVPGPTGLVRNLAAGAEARIHPRTLVRGGFRFNTRDDQPGGRTPVGTAGASYAVYGSLYIDGHGTFGPERSDRGWGVGARWVFY
jgi:hypothetical protein